MRLRAFLILLILLIIVAAGAVTVVLGLGGSGPLASLLSGGNGATAPPPVVDAGPADAAAVSTIPADALTQPESQQPEQPQQPAEPAMQLVPVVVARVPIPAGTTIRASLLTTEFRPNTNVAIRANYTFGSVEDLVGRIARVDIGRGQEVLDAMVALNPTDISAFGSDLALYLERGSVAVAFPIDRFSGMAYAVRPGDRLDVLMTMSLVEVDTEFQSALPNVVQEVNEDKLLAGEEFLFPPIPAGRLELIPLVNQVAFIGPRNPVKVLRPVTQLTIQQVEVLFVGTWLKTDNRELVSADQVRYESSPDLLILGMPTQDALTLKWALEVGIDIDLVLRAQGDTSLFATTSVSLPQMVEQSGVVIPEGSQFRLEPPVYSVPAPSVPAEPPPRDPVEGEPDDGTVPPPEDDVPGG